MNPIPRDWSKVYVITPLPVSNPYLKQPSYLLHLCSLLIAFTHAYFTAGGRIIKRL